MSSDKTLKRHIQSVILTLRLIHRVEKQSGFTLVEVLAVLIILGVLSAVAVPKFFGMQEEAERKALEVALNDMTSRAVLAHSRSLLANNGTAVAADYDTFAELGIAAANPCADCSTYYQNFAGTWGESTTTTIKYDMAHGTSGVDDVATFTLTPGDADNPSTITLSYGAS
jgi:MSHA pilin protein MshA